MIARVWTARTTPDKLADYRDQPESRVLPALHKLDGYAGMSLLSHADGEHAFAGDDVERAALPVVGVSED